MKVLITGASGNVGSYVLESLLIMGEEVAAAGTKPERLKNKYRSSKRVSPVYFDFTDKETFTDALEGVDRVFLMRPPHLGKPEDLLPFIEAAADKDLKLISFLSLMGVENNPVPPHHKIEKYIEKYNLPYAHIRPGFFMQNISGVHAYEIREEDRIFVPAGKSRTSFIDARDIGLAAATVLHTPGKFDGTSHTITGPEALDYYQVAEILTEVLGRKIEYEKPGLLKYRRKYIKERGLDRGYVNVTLMLYLLTRLGTAAKVTADFIKLTGKKPRTFREFAVDNIKAWQR